MDTTSELPIDVPDADVAEQAQSASPDRDDEPTPLDEELTEPAPEADEYDTAEQHRVVELDEDEYR